MALLSDEELLAFGVGADLDPVARAILLAATESLIESLFDGDERTDIRDGGSSIILLSRQAGDVADISIVETVGGVETDLDEDDWLLRANGRAIERLANGTNPPVAGWWPLPHIAWIGRVAVTYTPVDDAPDDAVLKMAQLTLIRLELARNPGLTSERIGEWAESYSAAGDSDTERAAILDALIGVIEPWSFA